MAEAAVLEAEEVVSDLAVAEEAEVVVEEEAEAEEDEVVAEETKRRPLRRN